MKRLAMLLLLVCFVTGLVFVGCEKKDDPPKAPDTKKIEKDAKNAADDAEKEADKAAEGLGDLAK